MPRDHRTRECTSTALGEEGRDALRCYLSNNEDSVFARTVMEHIDTTGYAVLRGVFSDAEVDEAAARQWKFVQTVNPSIRRGKPVTWRVPNNGGKKGDPWPMAQRDMFQLHQAGWLFCDIREIFADRVFAPLYGTHQLHTSKDGWTFQRPVANPGDLRRSPNDHFDQGHTMLGLHCIQGSLALTDQTPNDGCFSCWPGSHEFRETLLASMAPNKTRHDFIIVGNQQKQLLREYGIQPVRVPVNKGDVILWRSDLLHCGAPPVGACPTFRQVLYVCCMPAAMTPNEVYPLKEQAYDELKTGSHWPNREEWFKLNPRVHKLDQIRPYFKAPPVLTERQQQLHGLVRYPATTDYADGDDDTRPNRPSASPFVTAEDGSLQFLPPAQN